MKFNKLLKRKHRKPDTLNLAGGKAHTMTDELELVTMLLTSFLENKFYRNSGGAAKRITELVAKIADKQFVAKAAVYARREAGMRSVSHLDAGKGLRSLRQTHRSTAQRLQLRPSRLRHVAVSAA